MVFCVAGVSYKTAPVEVREKLSFGEKEQNEAYRLLLAKDEVEECVILSTCNRVEIYAMLKGPWLDILKNFIRDFHKFSESLDTYMYCKSSSDALRHLCLVAAGLDSMVLGEPQIFGQVKEAYAKAVEKDAVHYAFEHLFSQVFSIVKKIRSRTKIGEKNVSVSYTAVKLAQSIFSKIDDKKVMILGAGEMGELTVRNLISAGIVDVVVANRTFKRAVELSEKFKGTPIMLHELGEYLPQIDILISSITASDFIIKVSDLVKIMALRENHPIFLVDISVPRSIDPDSTKLENVHLYNIDDLRAVVDSNAEIRRKEAQKGEGLIEHKIPELSEYMKSYDLLPTLVSIRSKAEEIRKDGIARVIDTLTISSQEKEAIDSLTKTIVNKVLHHSELKLREYTCNNKQNYIKPWMEA